MPGVLAEHSWYSSFLSAEPPRRGKQKVKLKKIIGTKK